MRRDHARVRLDLGTPRHDEDRATGVVDDRVRDRPEDERPHRAEPAAAHDDEACVLPVRSVEDGVTGALQVAARDQRTCDEARLVGDVAALLGRLVRGCFCDSSL